MEVHRPDVELEYVHKWNGQWRRGLPKWWIRSSRPRRSSHGFLSVMVLMIVVEVFPVGVVSWHYLFVTRNAQQRNLLVFLSCLME